MFQSKWQHNSKIYRAEYSAWVSARQRCTNPKSAGWKYYGGRGIEMCQRWLNDFDAFMIDMGPRPKGMSIERQDVNGNYDPFNCIWATSKDQSRNMRRNRWLTHDGRTMIVEDWAKEIGCKATVILDRINRGFPIEKVLTKGSLVSPPKHGTISMYMGHKCRCELCRQANREYIAKNRHKFPSASKEYRNSKYRERKNAGRI